MALAAKKIDPVKPLNTNRKDAAMTAAPEKFTKKPVEIEAMQFRLGETTKGEIVAFCPDANIGVPIDENDPESERMDSTDIRWVALATLEGTMTVSDGDWIIKGIQGEFYPCKPDIFADSYDRVVGANDYARIYTDDAGEWRYQVFAGNHRLISASEDGKSDRSGVLRELKREWPHISKISEERRG